MRKHNDFLTDIEIAQDKLDVLHDDNISAADYQEAFDERFNNIAERKKPKLSIFDNHAYFDRLFPAFKTQKPGRDFYGRTTFFLALCAVFVFLHYG